MNALLDETRGARLKLDVEGFCTTLRAPESLHRLVMIEKPADRSAGDFALKAMLDAILIAHIVRGDYRAVQSILGALFGVDGTARHRDVPAGTEGAERHGFRPLAPKVAR